METIIIVHSGNAGDIIYSLSSMHYLHTMKGKEIDLYLRVGVPSTFTSLTHPVGNVMLNDTMFEMLKPLLLSQSYIHDVIRVEGNEKIEYDYDFDLFRKESKNLSAGDIKLWYSLAYPELMPSTTYKVLDASKYVGEEYIVINRSTRYNNPLIDYTLLEQLGKPIYFVGVEDEFKIMSAIIPNLKHKKVTDFLEMADFINSSSLFVGNQSMAFSIAEQLKVPRILEQYFGCPNVIPQGGQWSTFQTNKQFESIIKLIK